MRSLDPPRSRAADRKPVARAPRPAAGPRPAQAPRQFAGATGVRREAPLPAAKTDDGLPEGLQTAMEAMAGFSLADVVVHRNSAEPTRLGALAFTRGNQIHVAPGQERHLPHEAWHVVQQKQGRVRPTLQMKSGAFINDDARLEREADTMGVKALAGAATPVSGPWQMASRPEGPAQLRLPAAGQAVTQCVWIDSAAKYYRWDKLLGGLQWYFDPGADKYRYDIAVDAAVPIEFWSLVEANEGNPLSEQELLKLGFQPLDAAPEEARVLTLATPLAPAQSDPVTTIVQSDLNSKLGTVLPGSRNKVVYLFTASGMATASKVEARYMIDTAMDEDELKKYEELAKLGLPVPTIYGKHQKGYIVQWIGEHGTAGGAGARPLVPGARAMMIIDRMNKIPFDTAKWQRTLDDVNRLIDAKFASVDLQFMIERATGRIYLMDFDKANVLNIGKVVDSRLTELKTFLEEAIKLKKEPPSSTASSTSMFARPRMMLSSSSASPSSAAPSKNPFD